MRTSTTFNHINYLKGRIASIYANAKYSHPSQPQLTQQWVEIVNRYSAWNKMPDWARSMVHNYREERYNEIVNHYTIPLYVLPNGEKVTTRGSWDAFGEELREKCRNGYEVPLKTFWMDVEEKCDRNGNITVIKTPTDDVYWDSATMLNQN